MYQRQTFDGGVYVTETGNRFTPALLLAWIAAALAAGWVWTERYKGEDRDVSGNLSDPYSGCKLVYVNRPPTDRHNGTLSVSAYGPDGLALYPPTTFSPSALSALLRTCPECKATDVDTVRVGFANRACEKCAPALRKRIERPGWTL